MRWGYTARSTPGHADRGMSPRADDPDPVRHLWDGLPAKRKHAPVHAVCGAALRGLSPNREQFDPAHPRACSRCADRGRR
jgi:hypothetical protein